MCSFHAIKRTFAIASMGECEEDITVTLFSNSNIETDPTNKPADFTVRYCSPIRLSEKYTWEVALMKLVYPYNWQSVTDSMELLFVKLQNDSGVTGETGESNTYESIQAALTSMTNVSVETLSISIDPTDLHTHELQLLLGIRTVSENVAVIHGPIKLTRFRRIIPAGNYATVQHLAQKVCDTINQLPGHPNTATFKFTPASGLTEIIVSGPRLAMFARSQKLGEYLGLSYEKLPAHALQEGDLYVLGFKGVRRFELPVTNNILVYAPGLIEYQYVGNASTPCLNYTPACKENYGKYVSVVFKPPLYIKVAQRAFSYVRIMLRNDLGIEVPFPKDSMPVSCQLHFRRRI